MKINITWDNVKNTFWVCALISGALSAAHLHAVDEMEEAKEYSDMNAAEIQLLKTDMELKWLSFTPEEEMSAYELQKQSALLDDKEYWTERVRQIENQ